MEWAWILGIVMVSWFLVSMRHVADYPSEPLWIQIVGGMLYDICLLGAFIKEVMLTMFGIGLFLLLPGILLTEWIHTKWDERPR